MEILTRTQSGLLKWIHSRSHLSNNTQPLESAGNLVELTVTMLILFFFSVCQGHKHSQSHTTVSALDAAVVDGCCEMSMNLLCSWP